MLANVLSITLILALLVTAQFSQTLLYVKGATARNAARVADIAMNQVESDFITKASNGQVVVGPVQTLCLDGNAGTVQSGNTCTFTAVRSITNAGDTATAGSSPNEISTNVNTSIDETRSAYAMNVQILSASGSVLANKTRTITIRTIPNALTNEQYITVLSTSDSDDLIGGGRKGTPVSNGDTAGCDPSAQDCGDRSTIQSWSQCSADTAMAGGILNAAQAKWCAANAKNTGYANHSQVAPNRIYQSTTTYGERTWTNGNAAAAQASGQ